MSYSTSKPRTRHLKTTCGALFAGLGLSLSLLLPAQGASQEPGVPSAEELAAELAPRVMAPPFTESALIPRWRLFRAEEAGSVGETDAFDTMETTAFELGLTLLPAHSLVLLQESQAAYEEGDLGRSDQLLAWSERLAPRSSSREFALAKRALQTSVLDVTGYGGHLVTGYQMLWDTLAGRATMEVLWRATVLRFGGLLAVLMALGVFLRHAGQAAFDLRLASGRTLSLPQARLLLGLIAFAPALFLFSPALAVLTLIALTTPYLTWTERPIVLLLTAALLVTPRLAKDTANARTIESSSGQTVTLALTSPCDERCQERLMGSIIVGGDQNAELALGWVKFRQEGARYADEVRELAPVDSDVPGVASSAHVLLGNLAFVEGDLERARDHYERALPLAQTPGQRAAAAFNLYRVEDELGETEPSRAHLLEATQTHLAVVDRFRTYAGNNQNRLLMYSPLPTDAAYDAELARVHPETARTVLEAGLAPVFGELKTEDAGHLLLVLIALIVLGTVPYQRRLSAGRCSSCATPTSKVVFASAHTMGLCVMCYQLRTISGQLTYHQRTAREARVERWRTLSSRLKLFSNVVAPGLGFAVSGWTLVGATFGVLMAAGIALITTSPEALAIPYALTGDGVMYGLHGVGWFLIGGTWIASGTAGYLASKEEA